MSATDDLAAMSDAELSAAVAREVFGFWTGEHPEGVFAGEERWWGTDASGSGFWVHASCCFTPPLMGHSYRSSDGLPLFSTDLEAAWKIVEHLRERGHRVNVTNERDDVPWVAVFQHEKRYLTEFGTATADTAARAICLAALRAIRAARTAA